MATAVEVFVEEKNRKEVVALSEYADSYKKLLVETESTFQQLRGLGVSSGGAWDSRIKALRMIVKALEAGYEPMTPPANWGQGSLVEYAAPIPDNIMAKIRAAVPVFGVGNIVVLDPNREHFVKPEVADPIVAGKVSLEAKNYFFSIAAWDLDKDINLLRGEEIATNWLPSWVQSGMR